MAVHGCSPSCLSPDAFEAPFPQRSRPRLLTDAACGGLRPAPASRSRGTYPHLSRRLLRHTDVGTSTYHGFIQIPLLQASPQQGPIHGTWNRAFYLSLKASDPILA